MAFPHLRQITSSYQSYQGTKAPHTNTAKPQDRPEHSKCTNEQAQDILKGPSSETNPITE